MPSAPKDAAQLALEKLTPQRRKFVEAYCTSFNATKAALKAGYSKKTARTYGSQLLTFLDIKNAVKFVLDKSAMDPEEIAARWTRMARAGLDDFFTKTEYLEDSQVEAPLMGRIEKVEAEGRRDYEYTERSIAILGYDGERLAEYWDEYKSRERGRQLKVLQYTMELEANPAATYPVPGPQVKRYRVELDLVKAEGLGMLDLVKSITPSEHGMKVELRSPDMAMDNLAKWRGMLTTKVDITSGGEPVAAPPLLGVLSLEQKKELLEKRKQLRAQQEGAANG